MDLRLSGQQCAIVRNVDLDIPHLNQARQVLALHDAYASKPGA